MNTKLGKESETVLELMLKHGGSKGRISAKQLDEVQPGWDTGMKRANFSGTASRLRQSGKFKEARAAAGLNGVETNGADIPHDENTQLAIKIAKEYGKPNGGVDWKRAGEEHPDWKAKLSYPNGPWQRGLNILGTLRRKGLIPSSPFPGVNRYTKTGKSHEVEVQAALEVSALEVERRAQELVGKILSGAAFCPRCGNSLAAVFQAAKFNSKMA